MWMFRNAYTSQSHFLDLEPSLTQSETGRTSEEHSQEMLCLVWSPVIQISFGCFDIACGRVDIPTMDIQIFGNWKCILAVVSKHFM